MNKHGKVWVSGIVVLHILDLVSNSVVGNDEICDYFVYPVLKYILLWPVCIN